MSIRANKYVTYRRGFFFGPGRALGLSGSSDGGALFRPETFPPPLLRPFVAGGGANELLSAGSAAVLACGVELLSDDLSAGEASGGCIEGEAADCVTELEDEVFFDVGLNGKRASRSGEMTSLTMRLFLAVFGDDLAVDDGIVVGVAVDIIVGGVDDCGRSWLEQACDRRALPFRQSFGQVAFSRSQT